jgi:hypothetical protein
VALDELVGVVEGGGAVGAVLSCALGSAAALMPNAVEGAHALEVGSGSGIGPGLLTTAGALFFALIAWVLARR